MLNTDKIKLSAKFSIQDDTLSAIVRHAWRTRASRANSGIQRISTSGCINDQKLATTKVAYRLYNIINTLQSAHSAQSVLKLSSFSSISYRHSIET